MEKRFAILGAGAGGLTLARLLSDFDDAAVDVFEQSNRIGGLQKSIEHDGVHYDVGTFLFHQGHGLLEAFPQLYDIFPDAEYRPVSITPCGGYDRYPFSPGGYLRDNGALRTLLSGLDLLASKLVHRRRDTTPSYAKYYTGSMIYRRSGLQRYIHRLHDAPDSEIDVEFARRRLHVLSRQSLRKLAKKALSRGYRQKASASFTKRLVRPFEGVDYFYNIIREDVQSRGVDLRMEANLKSLHREGDSFVLNSDGGIERYDRVFSTIPIPDLLSLIGRAPSSNVENRDLISLFYRGSFANQAPTFFNFTDSGRWKRITVFSRFYGLDKGKDYFTVEVTAQNTSTAGIADARRDFEDHARQFKLLDGPAEFVGAEITPRAYPLYRRGALEAIEREKRGLREYGIELVGRQGNFEYIISDNVAKRAGESVDRLRDQLRSNPEQVVANV